MKRSVLAIASTAACLALASVLLSAPAVCLAQSCPIVVPTGIEAGEQYRLAFLTSGTMLGESTDIADYNAFVSAAANAVPELAALETQWFAIASTAAVDARSNTGTTPPGDVPIYLLNDTMIATSYNDLWDWSIAIPLDYTELCEAATGSNHVWTGTHVFGTVDNPLGSSTPTTGSRAMTGQQWIRNGGSAANQPYALYAISDVLTVSSVPTEGRSWGTLKGDFR